MPVFDSTTVMDMDKSLPLHTGDVYGLAVSDEIVATASGDRVIRVFNRADLSEKAYSPLHIHKYHVISCAVTHSGDRLVSASMDGRASVVELSTGKLVAVFNQPNGIGMRTCCISANDQLMAVGAVDGTITVVEMESYKAICSMSMNDDESVLALTFTPDSHWLISGHSVTGDLRVWNVMYLSNKYAAYAMKAHEQGAYCLDMCLKSSQDADSAKRCYKFASGGEDCMICLWEISYDEHETKPKVSKITTLVGHTSPVYSVKFSSDGQSLVSCGGDSTIRLWNLDGDCVFVNVDAHRTFINSCSFSIDMKLVYSASSDRTVKVWKLTDTYSLKAADKSLLRNGVGESDPGTTEQSKLSSATPTSSRSRSGGVASWSVDDVCDWLSRLGLSKYSAVFRKNEMDGRELVQLDHKILEEELGIVAFGSRNKIVQGVEDLLTGNTAESEKQCEVELNSGQPHEFLCPITHQVMADPVVASDGY